MESSISDRLLAIAKAVVAAAVAAAVTVLTDQDWGEIIGATLASGGLTWLVPNRTRAPRG